MKKSCKYIKITDFTFLLYTCGCNYDYEFKKMCDFEIDKRYKATNFTILKTKYGNKLSEVLNKSK